MTKIDIVELATLAGFTQLEFYGNKVGTSASKCLDTFATLVAEREREECAKVCEEHKYKSVGLANAIRARQ